MCRTLAQAPEEIATVVRVPEKAEPLPKSPDVLACHFGSNMDDAPSQDTGVFDASRLAFRLSEHVLEAVRSTGNAAMVRTIFSSDTDITRAVVDEQSPRAVICAPIGDGTEMLDLLYVDVPIDRATPDMLAFVKAVSRQTALSRKRLILMQMKAERSVLDYQLSLAQQIQSRLAPVIPRDLSGVDLELFYKPTIWVGGDYCDVWLVDDGRLAFAVGDVCSTGLSAAMAMSDLRGALRTTASFCSEPSEIANKVNSLLVQILPPEMSVSLFLGLFSPKYGTLEYVNAGHLQPLIIQPKSIVASLGQPDNPPLATGNVSFQADVETLPQGACLCVFTDGITQTLAPGGKEFGVRPLMHLLKTTGSSSAARMTNSIVRAVEDFRNPCPQRDDITLLILLRPTAENAATT